MSGVEYRLSLDTTAGSNDALKHSPETGKAFRDFEIAAIQYGHYYADHRLQREAEQRFKDARIALVAHLAKLTKPSTEQLP